MPRSSEFHIAPGHTSGQIKSPTLSGQVGDPSSYASTSFSRGAMSTPLAGFYDEECDDEYFDCADDEEEEMNERLLREFVRGILLSEGITLTLNPSSHMTMHPGPAPTAETEEDEEVIDEDDLGADLPYPPSLKTMASGEEQKSKEDIIDEDELEEEDEVEEINAIGMGGGSGVSRGTIRGVTLPLGQSPPSHGRKRRTPAEAAGSGFGGAKLASKAYMPGKRKKGKKRKSRK